MVFPRRDEENCVLRIFVSIVFDYDRSGTVYDKKDFIRGMQMIEKAALIDLSDRIVVLKKYLFVLNVIIHVYTLT